MKTRIITAVISAVMFAIIILLGREAYGIFMMILDFIAINELYNAFENIGAKPIRIFSFICAAPLGVLTFAQNEAINGILMSHEAVLYIGVFIYLIFVMTFSLTIIEHKKHNLNDAAMTFVAGIVTTYLFSFLINITYLGKDKSSGLLFLLLLLVAAWGTDTFAYFTGSFFGKRKLAPEISPKKTIEGSIGGVAGAMILVTLYGHFVLGYTTKDNLVFFLVLGFFSSILSQIGDLVASVIKRYCRIKDYGHLMPGHGGVLDRFDSVLFVAPLIYYYFRFFI